MCDSERKTTRRGFSWVPATRARTRSWRRIRPAVRLVVVISFSLLGAGALGADLAGLAGLATDDLARVLHALRLVRVGDAQPADLRGHLADELLVDPAD